MTTPEDEILNQLDRRCPFCGGSEVYVKINRMPPRMNGPGLMVSVEISHDCQDKTYGVLFNQRRVRARDEETAIKEWNRRIEK